MINTTLPQSNTVPACTALGSGVWLAFRHIAGTSAPAVPPPAAGAHLLSVEFCRRGRHALPAGDYCTIAADGHAAVSMTAAGADDYYPGAVYEGLQFWIDPDAQTDSGFLALMGLDVHGIINYFCAGGPYYCPMGDELAALVDELWREFDVSGYASPGELRYAVVRLLYMLLQLPYADQMAWYPRAQVDLVRDAETLMLADLSVRHTARELAVQFGVSESSFKAYCRDVLGDGYLPYFRRKRLEKAAGLLAHTDLKVQDIAVQVGYESQSKFAKAFADQFRLTPLEYRRLAEK